MRPGIRQKSLMKYQRRQLSDHHAALQKELAKNLTIACDKAAKTRARPCAKGNVSNQSRMKIIDQFMYAPSTNMPDRVNRTSKKQPLTAEQTR